MLMHVFSVYVSVCSHGFLTPLQGRKALLRFFLACWMRYCLASLRGSLSASRSNIRLKDFSKKPFCRAHFCLAMPPSICRPRWADSLNKPGFGWKDPIFTKCVQFICITSCYEVIRQINKYHLRLVDGVYLLLTEM